MKDEWIDILTEKRKQILRNDAISRQLPIVMGGVKHAHCALSHRKKWKTNKCDDRWRFGWLATKSAKKPQTSNSYTKKKQRLSSLHVCIACFLPLSLFLASFTLPLDLLAVTLLIDLDWSSFNPFNFLTVSSCVFANNPYPLVVFGSIRTSLETVQHWKWRQWKKLCTKICSAYWVIRAIYATMLNNKLKFLKSPTVSRNKIDVMQQLKLFLLTIFIIIALIGSNRVWFAFGRDCIGSDGQLADSSIGFRAAETIHRRSLECESWKVWRTGNTGRR